MGRSLDPLRRTMRRTFDIGDLRPGQGEVIASVLGGTIRSRSCRPARESRSATRDAIRALGDPPILALTATATTAVTDDIRRLPASSGPI